jgi:hypothetical protein
LREMLRRDNKERDRLQGVESVEGGQEDVSLTAFMDLTDKENPNFRYIY